MWVFEGVPPPKCLNLKKKYFYALIFEISKPTYNVILTITIIC